MKNIKSSSEKPSKKLVQVDTKPIEIMLLNFRHQNLTYNKVQPNCLLGSSIQLAMPASKPKTMKTKNKRTKESITSSFTPIRLKSSIQSKCLWIF